MGKIADLCKCGAISATDKQPQEWVRRQMGRNFQAVLVALLIVLGAIPAARSEYVRREEGAQTVIVFVHGLGSNSVSSWTNGKTYWPNLLTSEPMLKGVDVFVYEYPTSFFSDGMTIDELSEDMRIRLNAARVGDYKNVVFIGHSMGGLVTRSFLIKNPEVRERTRFLYLLGAPSQGSSLASVLSFFGGSPQVRKLQTMKSAEYLADMARQWSSVRGNVETFCAYETRKTKGAMVVDMASATYLCSKSFDPIDADHEEIAKPTSSRSPQHEAFLNAYQITLIDRVSEGDLSFQYARLFGAVEVPLLMGLLPDPGFRRSEMGEGYRAIVGRKQVVDDIQTKLAKYVERLPFKDAAPLLLPIWRDVAGSSSAATSIAWRSASASRDERSCVVLEPLVDGGSQYNAEVLGRIMPAKWETICPGMRKNVYERTGFTFLVVENTSESTLRDVTIDVEETYSRNPVKRELTESTPLVEVRASLLRMPRAGSKSLVEQFGSAKSAEQEIGRAAELKLAAMKPGSKVILLLNVYFANDDKLPAGYLYGRYEPKHVSYLKNARKERTEIRAPYGERAARQLVPYGWFNQ